MPEDHEYDSGHKTPREKQQKVLTALARVNGDGLTSREMAEIEDPGNVSAGTGWASCFSVLHQEKLVACLTAKREGYRIYLLPEFVYGRETWPGYRHKGTVVETKTIIITRTEHCATCTCEET
jgi:hypothetical protein